MISVFVSALYILSGFFATEFDSTGVLYGSVAQWISDTSERVVTAPTATRDSVTFLGDVLLARAVERSQTVYGNTYPFDGYTFASSSFVVANFEAAIPKKHRPTPDMQLRFSSRAENAALLQRVGITHVSLANNHALDFGAAGYQNTSDVLTAADVQWFGHPSVLSSSSITVLEVADSDIAIVGVHTLFGTVSTSSVRTVLAQAASVSDYQVVYVHWGPEYQLKASPHQRAMARVMVEAGADLIIGHHPHVVQEVELLDGVPVFYSLGNYIFDQYFSTDVQQGLVVTVEVAKDRVVLQPVTSVASRHQPRAMSDSEAGEFLADLADRSDPILHTAIVDGSLALDWRFATSTKIAMIE